MYEGTINPTKGYELAFCVTWVRGTMSGGMALKVTHTDDYNNLVLNIHTATHFYSSMCYISESVCSLDMHCSIS